MALPQRPWPWTLNSVRRGSPAELGKEGERLAAKYLRKRGYKILLRNVRLGQGELDLICRHEDQLVFVEVKTRTYNQRSRPADAIYARKRRSLIHAAMLYLKELDYPNVIYRFDVVEVVVPAMGPWEINVIPNAFGFGR